MAIDWVLSADQRTLEIDIHGEFLWLDADAFQAAYSNKLFVERYRLRMADCRLVDHSALSMLLTLRDLARAQGARLHIDSISPVCREIFHRACLDILLT